MNRPRKKKPSSNWLTRCLAEWKYWWNHGLSQKKRRWANSWKQKRKGAKRWWSSRAIEKKIQEQERKRYAKKFNRRVKKAPQQLGERINESATGVLNTPGKLLKRSRKTFKRLRKLTFRELVHELWNIYLSILAYLLNIPRRLFRRWKRQKALMQWYTAGLAVFLFICLLFSSRIIEEAKKMRAKSLHEQAVELIEREQLNLAYEKTRSAALLNPDDEEYIEQAIELADLLRHPHAVWWAERMAKRKDYDEKSLSKIIEQSLQYNQLGTGARYVSVMRARYPESMSALDAELDLLIRQNLLEQALIKADEQLKIGRGSPMVYRVFVELALYTTDEDMKKKARYILLDRLENEDKISLELLKLSQRMANEEMERINAEHLDLHQRIREHPLATRLDRIEASGFAFFTDHLSEEEAFADIASEFDFENDAELEEALDQLSRFGIYYGRDSIISEIQIYSDPQFALAYLEWLIFSEEGDLDEAEELLADTDKNPLPINETKRRFWQAIIASLRDDEQNYALHMLQAVDNSTSNEWDYMHPILLKHTSAHQQHAFYRELFGRPESPILAAERYLMLTYGLGMEEELQIIMRQLHPERFINRPETLNFLLYLNAVHDYNLGGTRAQLEDLIGKYPKAALFYRNLGFVYAKLDEFGLARAINREIPPPPDSANAYIRLAHAYITQDPSSLPNLDELPTQSERDLWQSIIANKSSL